MSRRLIQSRIVDWVRKVSRQLDKEDRIDQKQNNKIRGDYNNNQRNKIK